MSFKLIHGIDVTQINRPELNQPNIANRILSQEELSYFNDDNDKQKFIAVRWAIKEAIFKAVSPDIIGLRDITIIKSNNVYVWINKPSWVKQLIISTSNEHDVIIASVFGIRE